MATNELTPSQRESLALLTSTADRLEKAVAGLSDKELDHSPAPGEWSIRRIVHHLVDGNLMWTFMFNQAIAGFGATLRVDGKFPGSEAWADVLEYHRRPIQAAVATVVSSHRFMAEAAAHFPDRWERYVTFPGAEGKEAQKITAGQTVKMLGEHLAEHVGRIEDIGRTQALGGGF